MKVISSRLHAILDYVTGLFVAASPWIFQLRESDAASWVLMAVGLSILIMSAFTNYEGGMVRSLPMSAHLTTDFVVGAFTAASPWIFGFAETVYLPHLIIGIFILGTTGLTNRQAYTDRPERNEHIEGLKRSTPVDSKFTE